MNVKLRQAVITLGLEAIALTGAGRFIPGAAGRGVIFTLHHVRPATDRSYEPNALLSITPEFLDTAIEEVKGRGYRPVALADLPDQLAGSEPHEKFVVFTLDDGLRDNAVHAAPVFAKHGVPYTIFVAKGLSEHSHTMWWETAEILTREQSAFSFDFGNGEETVACGSEADKLVAFNRLAEFVETIDEDQAVARINDAARTYGIDPLQIVRDEVMDGDEIATLAASDPLADFGAHTITHCNLARVEADRLKREIDGSVAAVENWTLRPVETFAYPYGWARACGEREAEAVRAAGLKLAVTTGPGVITDKHASANWYLQPRVSLNGLYQRRRYVAALMNGVPFRLMGA